MYPESSDPFYVVTYYTKWVTTSWTHSIVNIVSSFLKYVLYLIFEMFILLTDTLLSDVNRREGDLVMLREYKSNLEGNSIFKP